MEFDNFYLGDHGYRVALLEDELTYFHSVVDSVLSILGIVVDVKNLNHKKAFCNYDSKMKEPGVFHAENPSRPWENCFITIDNLFIHKCYTANLMGLWRVGERSLEDVLCHQIAHMTVYRDCKRHAELTNTFIAAVHQRIQNEHVTLPTYEEFVQMEFESPCMFLSLYSSEPAEGA